MPFIETKAKSEYKIIDGKKTHVITPECEITLTNTKTGKEYMSDKEADDDVNDQGFFTIYCLIFTLCFGFYKGHNFLGSTCF